MHCSKPASLGRETRPLTPRVRGWEEIVHARRQREASSEAVDRSSSYATGAPMNACRFQSSIQFDDMQRTTSRGPAVASGRPPGSGAAFCSLPGAMMRLELAGAGPGPGPLSGRTSTSAVR